jgi:hypothetical protein
MIRNGTQLARCSNRERVAVSSAGLKRADIVMWRNTYAPVMPRLACWRLDQLLVGSFEPDVWQAMHEATPGSKVSNEVCANCQITATMLKMQSTKIRISSAVLPFSCERTNSL